MIPDALRLVLVSVAGVLFWTAATAGLNAPEPWDAALYPAWCLAALGLAAAFGRAFPDRAWRWGALIVLAQLPVMLVGAGLGPLIGPGLFLLALEALPAALASMAAARLRTRRRARD